MAYNLPPAWDAGFAMPKNVRDEGLERRAFVTKQMPRGTYDDSTDGTAGYNVPQYIKDEGTGQGAFTTFWQPRGTYNGGKVPHWLNQRPTVTGVAPIPGGGTQVTVQTGTAPAGMGDDAPIGEPFDTYGQRAASVMITAVSGLPAGQRQKVLKAMMDKVDKSLWGRTQDIFRRYVQQKMAPANAFPLALARALSTGIAAEIITSGVQRTAPQANSLLGLGCYGCEAAQGAMGDVAWPQGCSPAPTGFTWLYTATVNGQSIPGRWARLPAGQTPQPFCSGVVPPGALTVADPTGTGAPPPPIEVREHVPTYDMFVGPFGFDTSVLKDRVWGVGTPSDTVANRAASPDIIYLTPGALPQGPQLANVRPMIPQVMAWLKARLIEAQDSSGNTDTPVHYTDSAAYGFPEPDAKTWFDAMAISADTPVRLHKLWQLRTTESPFARTKHIKTGADMVLNLRLSPLTYGKDWDAKTNPLVLNVWLSRVPDKSIFGALWNPMILINPLTALQATADIVSGVANVLGDLACDVLTHPAAGTVAGAAAAAEGIPPQAGTTGVAIAASQCGKAPPPVVPVVKHSIWPWVIMGGGAIVAVALLTRPRKATTP